MFVLAHDSQATWRRTGGGRRVSGCGCAPPARAAEPWSTGPAPGKRPARHQTPGGAAARVRCTQMGAEPGDGRRRPRGRQQPLRGGEPKNTAAAAIWSRQGVGGRQPLEGAAAAPSRGACLVATGALRKYAGKAACARRWPRSGVCLGFRCAQLVGVALVHGLAREQEHLAVGRHWRRVRAGSGTAARMSGCALLSLPAGVCAQGRAPGRTGSSKCRTAHTTGCGVVVWFDRTKSQKPPWNNTRNTGGTKNRRESSGQLQHVPPFHSLSNEPLCVEPQSSTSA